MPKKEKSDPRKECHDRIKCLEAEDNELALSEDELEIQRGELEVQRARIQGEIKGNRSTLVSLPRRRDEKADAHLVEVAMDDREASEGIDV